MRWFIWAALGCLVAIQPSYIHPDEHFQSLEILAIKFGQIKGSIPWEFDSANAARSFIPLYLNYGFIFKFFDHVRPRLLLSIVRLQNFLTYLWAYKFALAHIGHSYEADFLISTSYITSCYQSHSFSNSLETVLLLVVLSLYNDLIRLRHKRHCLESVLLGITIALGIFNRITFPVFIVVPSFIVFWQFYRKSLFSLAVFTAALLCSIAAFIYTDTLLYNSTHYVIAPWNNLRYNLDVSNLAQHGLHPWYTHFLINLPQLVGPSILFVQAPRRSLRTLANNMPLLSIYSGITLLSIFKHQELRFLIPLAPLFFMCSHFRESWNKIGVYIWIAFNLFMGIIMGCLHQSGVIRLLDAMRQDKLEVHVWWKTYSPPTWMYANKNLVASTTNFVNDTEKVENVDFSIVHDHVVDLKGCDTNLLNYTLTQFLSQNAQVALLAPKSVSSLLNLLNTTFRFIPTRSSNLHLDLDHIDIADSASWSMGLIQYNVIRNDYAHYYTSIVNN
ncbi:related to GPI mannosyltransferase 4 [Zygosaccharomyces bailii ISA1307]|uniref:Mannosyltransferase n=1 Tax=Zygosaccharomyces bailii (strain CLIB 213 / ATCC 58445 / CBS 680 / BCRC 21525 / NBRC 1098 / NCYC 1416 / NRRL Y-2227) TaxID=1333698 RepID=A0A8J2T6Q3_ZYGB2|nr:ZYBA0S05-04786g1_1 [Zygosaccharomyces bailii CLIB 213]CDH17678.1 related to GPI mannosyltransferase 4 [Zygosaccharomyces bailii ISA1307]